jgi:hypothetical protein
MIKYYIILSIAYSSIALCGPLDIEAIKKECLKKYKNESSKEYTKCLKVKINDILFKKKL